MAFIVTGTPRAATKYASRLFTALGVPCVHEGIVRPLTSVVDVLRWFRHAEGGESSWMAWTVLPLLPNAVEVPVLHTIRDPWRVIDSLTNRNSILRYDEMHTTTMRAIRDTIDTYAPRVWKQESRVDRAAAMVVDWYKAIRQAVPTSFIYRVEMLDVPTVTWMLAHIGIERTPEEITAALADVSDKTNEGYTIRDIEGVSDPIVAEWIAEYAKEKGITEVVTRRVQNVSSRDTPEELAAKMSPGLLEEVNQYAARFGYATVACPVAA